jgi:DNA-binding MarR family transcriptional regulator
LKIQQRCYELWAQGKSHTDIARLAEVAPNTVTKYVKRFLAAQPIASLSREEREAAIFAEWAEIGQRMRADMEEQRHRGRIKVVRTRHPDGSETVEQSMITGVDPQLYRAWGAHLDRKARQLLDQTPISEGGNVVNVSVVRDFLGQGDAPAARLSAEQWNQQAIDV